MKTEKFNILKIVVLLLFFLTTSCQSLKTRSAKEKDKDKGILTPIKQDGPKNLKDELPQWGEPESSTEETESAEEEPTPQIEPVKKIGVILGGGGALTYAHLAFLKALQDHKIPLHSIAGIEMAAPMGALYAHRQNSNEVEWQMYKLKDEDFLKKNLFGQPEKYASKQILKDFLKSTMAGKSFSQLDIPFFCGQFWITPSKLQIYSSGNLENILPGCSAYPPYFSVGENQVAAVREVYGLVREMRKNGTQRIIFINVLTNKNNSVLKKDALDELLWKEIQFEYSRVQSYVDEVINLDTTGFGVMDFNKRRDIQYKSATNLGKAMPEFARKWGY